MQMASGLDVGLPSRVNQIDSIHNNVPKTSNGPKRPYNGRQNMFHNISGDPALTAKNGQNMRRAQAHGMPFLHKSMQNMSIQRQSSGQRTVLTPSNLNNQNKNASPFGNIAAISLEKGRLSNNIVTQSYMN